MCKQIGGWEGGTLLQVSASLWEEGELLELLYLLYMVAVELSPIYYVCAMVTTAH